MIRVGIIQKYSDPKQIDLKYADLALAFYKRSLKRISPITVRTGADGSDFTAGLTTAVLYAYGVKIPRFMNPVRAKRRGKIKLPKY